MDIVLAVVCVLVLSIILLYLGQRFKLPSIVSYLVIGMLVGPFGFALITDQTLIDTIGQIGIILLLFTIGLEFSFQTLLRSWRAVIIGGLVQVCTTIVAITLITLYFQMPFNEALIFGFIVSLSSTAIVMKILQERGEVDTIQGRTLLGILIFQDLAIIPMMLVLPLLAGMDTGLDLSAVPYQITKIALIILAIIVLGYWVIPRLLFRVAKERSRELFLFTIAGICVVIAWLTSEAGLSFTLGAFIGGLIIGESDYNIDALGHIIPFRDVFAAIFFLSIGMLLNTATVFGNFGYVALIILIIFCVKVLTGAFSAAVLGMQTRVCVFCGLALAQIGEFSFVLAKSGLDAGVIQTPVYQIFLTGAIVTMAFTPFAMNASPKVVDMLYQIFPKRISRVNTGAPDEIAPEEALSNHIIIAGYGLTGKSVARAATLAGIPYMVIELNPEIIREERSQYRPNFIFGDAVQEEVLEHAGIRQARTLVVAVSEEAAVPRIIHTARQLSPEVHILARTRHIRNAQYLLDLGADEVISEEFESALEIFTRALQHYQIPEEEVVRIIERSKRLGNALFTRCTDPNQHQKIQNFETLFKETHVHTVQVETGSAAEGKTIADLSLKDRFGIREFGFRRGTMRFTQPDPALRLKAGDTLVFFITDEKAGKIIPLFSAGNK
ncbi:monovalent cation:proton antiporter family protein [Methanoregula sp.]|jgi:CPA2 family monovalent cation:H+ antiporter-2|uniref:monovalent cation:proton antiporter family protein n=1 Tax=Methanoregula sp. TaxID=2052170 RepID=UPI0025DC5774|nr:monovalent cation:proton antiporter family protein [Methanoregula sp.]